MGNQDLEHALNPWMFDKSGNLTTSAQKQFPGFSGAETAITTGAPAASCGSLIVNPQALNSAGQNALNLESRMDAECNQPESNASSAYGALTGWATANALNSAVLTWQSQYLTLAGNIGQVGNNLSLTATSYLNNEQNTSGHMRGVGN